MSPDVITFETVLNASGWLLAGILPALGVTIGFPIGVFIAEHIVKSFEW